MPVFHGGILPENRLTKSSFLSWLNSKSNQYHPKKLFFFTLSKNFDTKVPLSHSRLWTIFRSTNDSTFYFVQLTQFAAQIYSGIFFITPPNNTDPVWTVFDIGAPLIYLPDHFLPPSYGYLGLPTHIPLMIRSHVENLALQASPGS